MRPQAKNRAVVMIDTEGCIFFTEFSVRYIILKYCTDPWGMHVTYLPTFCGHFLLDCDPGETSIQNLLPSLGSGEFLCQKIYTLVVVAKHSLHVGWRTFFVQFCCCVSFLFWQEIGFGFTYLHT